jgi:hypothetical protein
MKKNFELREKGRRSFAFPWQIQHAVTVNPVARQLGRNHPRNIGVNSLFNKSVLPLFEQDVTRRFRKFKFY